MGKVWDTPFIEKPANSRRLSYKIEGEPIEYINKYDAHRPVTSDEAPKYIYFDYKSTEKYKSNLPDIFKMRDSIIIISERFYTLLQDFDLGETQLIEVPLYEYDQTTLRPERYFILHLVASKNCFLPEHSKRIKELNTPGFWMRDISIEGEDALAVSPDALAGVDLWVDPHMHERIFFSDRLKIAIKEHAIKAIRMKIRPVKVIG